jgi:hypothetical protein
MLVLIDYLDFDVLVLQNIHGVPGYDIYLLYLLQRRPHKSFFCDLDTFPETYCVVIHQEGVVVLNCINCACHLPLRANSQNRQQ